MKVAWVRFSIQFEGEMSWILKYTLIASRDTAELRGGHQRKQPKAKKAKEEKTKRTEQGAKKNPEPKQQTGPKRKRRTKAARQTQDKGPIK